MSHTLQTAHYSSPDASLALDIRHDNNTIWMSQSQMAQLFGLQRPAITKQIKNVLQSEDVFSTINCLKKLGIKIINSSQSVIRLS